MMECISQIIKVIDCKNARWISEIKNVDDYGELPINESNDPLPDTRH